MIEHDVSYTQILPSMNLILQHFFSAELTINKTKIDETGIRFPDFSSSNVSEDTEEFSTFLELPKQDTKAEKGRNSINIKCSL